MNPLSFSKIFIGITLFGILFVASCKSTDMVKADKTKTNTVLKEKSKDEIYERYKELMDATSNGNIAKTLDLTHPKLYKLVSKEQIAASMRDVFSSIKMETTELSIQNYSPMHEFEGEKYVLLDYTAKMKIFNSDENMDIGTFAEIMGVTYGKENVSALDKESILIDVKGKSTFAVSYKEDGKWYFIENNNEHPFYNQLIPLEIQEKLGLNEDE